jgi:Putative MetA-pathway of phenol degradation
MRPCQHQSTALWLLQLLHDLIDAEARRPLPWRELLECRDELTHDGLCRYDDESVPEYPIIVGVRRDFGALIGIHAQIEQRRGPRAHERLPPHRQRPFGSLLTKHDFPILHTNSHELAVVVEIKECLARRLGYDYRQLSDDTGAGVPAILNGFKGEVDAVGPGLTYTTQIGKIPFIFNARHYEEFNVKSRFDNSVTIITGTFVF